jgi:hypothetical protein
MTDGYRELEFQFSREDSYGAASAGEFYVFVAESERRLIVHW